jgi:hypothetical protein
VINNQELLKISEDYCFLGEFRGRSPPKHKNGVFKAEGLISGWGKCRKTNSFRIIGQGNLIIKKHFKIFTPYGKNIQLQRD